MKRQAGASILCGNTSDSTQTSTLISGRSATLNAGSSGRSTNHGATAQTPSDATENTTSRGLRSGAFPIGIPREVGCDKVSRDDKRVEASKSEHSSCVRWAGRKRRAIFILTG